MEKLRGSHLLDRGERFLTCWQELATPETEFAGIRHQELKDGVATAQAARERVRAVELWLRGLRLERDQADRQLAVKLQRVASGVRADPAFGDDCGLYRALGFVPLSENRSGRPRKAMAKPGKAKGKPA